MKRTLAMRGYILFVSFALLLNACSKTDSAETSKLSVDKNSINCEREGAHQLLNIVSSGNWTAALSVNADWLSIDKTSGSGSTVIKLSTLTNPGMAARTATLTLKSAGVADAEVTITQKGIMAWEKMITANAYSGSGFFNVITVSDGFVVVGRKNTGFYIAKISPDGQTVLKENTLAGFLEGKAIVMDPDGNFVVTGTTSAGNTFPGENIFAIKLDADLQPVPGKLFVLDSPNQDFATSIIRISGGGYAISGFRGGSMYAVKLDENLQPVTGKEFMYNPASISSVAYGIAETADGGFALAATSTEPDGQDIHIIKLDANFAMVPGKDLVINESSSDNVACIKPTSDGGFIFAGLATRNSKTVTYVQKLDAGLQPVLGKKINFDKGVFNHAVDIIEKPDHGFIVLGNIYNSDNSDRNFLISTLDQNLQPVAGMEFTINKKSTDVPLAIKAAPDGGFVIAGYFFDNNSTNLYLARFNK